MQAVPVLLHSNLCHARCPLPRLQARLHTLFPGLAEEDDGAAPGWLRWAFACVRSRAFRLGPERYAFVPFLDAANHAPAPRAAYREAGGAVELVALAGGLAAGEEVTISYCGGTGCARDLGWGIRVARAGSACHRTRWADVPTAFESAKCCADIESAMVSC